MCSALLLNVTSDTRTISNAECVPAGVGRSAPLLAVQVFLMHIDQCFFNHKFGINWVSSSRSFAKEGRVRRKNNLRQLARLQIATSYERLFIGYIQEPSGTKVN
jgi:hypothetical protein